MYWRFGYFFCCYFVVLFLFCALNKQINKFNNMILFSFFTHPYCYFIYLSSFPIFTLIFSIGSLVSCHSSLPSSYLLCIPSCSSLKSPHSHFSYYITSALPFSSVLLHISLPLQWSFIAFCSYNKLYIYM